MITDLTLTQDKNGKFQDAELATDYQPNQRVRERTCQVMRDFQRGTILRNKPYAELNWNSFVNRLNLDRLSYNQYVESPSEDPAESWKCVSEDTEIFSIDGWKKIGELKKGDEVLSYDLETGELLPDTVRNTFIYDIDGEMVSIKNQHTDQLITPNHRVIAKEFKRQKFYSDELKDQRKRFWEDKYTYQEARNLSRGCIDYRLPLAGNYSGSFSIGEDWAELVGWMLTDGCMPKKGSAYITQSKPLTLVKIRSLLVSMGVEFREWSREKTTKGKKCFDEHRFYFPNRGEVMTVMNELIPGRKPTNNLWHLPTNEKRRLLDGLCFGDGSKREGKDYYESICKPCPNFKEWLQTLLHLMDTRSTVSKTCTSIGQSNAADIVGKKHIKTVQYKGRVWSIETGRTNYMARRNGQIFITGNSRAFRPIVRNKINTIAAYVSQQYIYPDIYAENDNCEEDKDAAMVMRDLMKWRNEKAGYEKAFLHAVLDALTDPVSFLGTEYNELYREHKELSEDGKTWTVKKVLDEEFSGFHDEIVPCDEIWIADIYEPELQRQPFVIRRRAFHFATAKTKYADNPLFEKYVKPGLQFLYSDDQQVFYRMYDSSLRDELVEEVIYWNRGADLRLRFVNGILMDDVDQPNPRKDKKYPMAKTGYEWINNRFFYYKSCAFKLANDEEVVNTAYRMLADASYLAGMPPAVQFGKEEISSAVMVPGGVTSIDNTENPNAGFQVLETKNNLGALTGLIERAEASISESSANSVMAGNLPNARTPAFVMAAMQQNARTLLGLFEKMIGFLVKEFGELCIADVIQHLTVGELQEIEGKESAMRYGKFLMPEQNVNGKSVSRMISFDPTLPSGQLSKQDHLKMSQDIYAEENQKYDDKVQLVRVNPELFRKLKFKIVIAPEAIVPMSDAVKKSLMLEEYNLALVNPLTKKDAITRDLLLGAYDQTKNSPDKYLMSAEEQQAAQQAAMGQPMPTGGQPQPLSKGLSDNLQTETNPLKNALARK